MFDKVLNEQEIKKFLKLSPPQVFYKKKLLLKISQHSQENTCARISF